MLSVDHPSLRDLLGVHPLGHIGRRVAWRVDRAFRIQGHTECSTRLVESIPRSHGSQGEERVAQGSAQRFAMLATDKLLEQIADFILISVSCQNLEQCKAQIGLWRRYSVTAQLATTVSIEA